MAYPQIITPYAILSFPTLFSPKPRSEGGEPVYSLALLFDEKQQKTPEFRKMKDAVEEVIKDRFGKVPRNQLYNPFRDGAEKADKYQGYEQGVVFIGAWSKRKPPVIDRNKEDVLLPEQVFAGQLVRAAIQPFPFDVSGKKGVSWGLNSVQIVKADMPRIDGSIPPKQAFPDLPDEEDDDESPF
jgi:Protein of unknown function (DUF2815)